MTGETVKYGNVILKKGVIPVGNEADRSGLGRRRPPRRERAFWSASMMPFDGSTGEYIGLSPLSPRATMEKRGKAGGRRAA